MLLSYIIAKNKRFTYRWLFGGGVLLFCIGTGVYSTQYRQQESEFVFDTHKKLYRGIVIDIPQDKPKSIAYKVILADYNKKIICYFRKDSSLEKLKPGDEFLFYTSPQPFQNFKEENNFDYVTYMRDQGFSGSAYVSLWKSTGKVDKSLKIYAQRWRQQILNVYQSLGFDNNELAILSALTIGYQDIMPDDLKQSFRTTGTIHVLSVSGLHVGIIYLIIAFLLKPIRRRSKFYKIKPLLIIVLLLGYAFITGLSPSVNRASLMLTMFCLSELFNKKNDSVHSMYITAFLILLYNPLSFFDIGFQLSFLSVMGILYLQPRISNLLLIRNKYLNNIWQGFILSWVAQLATFPLCLYYFGTFPTYFFITNVIIVPLVTLIMYAFSGIVIAKSLCYIFPTMCDYLFYLPIKILQLLLCILTNSIKFFESLPFALIQNVRISFVELCLIYAIIVSTSMFFIKNKPVYLKIILLSILSLFVSNIIFINKVE